jgi:hypothetical protein
MRFKYSFLISLCISILSVSQAFATHIRAGEITAERVSIQTLTYKITVVGYTDTRSSVEFGPGFINFGDGKGNIELSKEEFTEYAKRYKAAK